MNTNSTQSSIFICTRQRPTHEQDEFETLGPVEFFEFTAIFRSIDWRHEANQAEWSRKAAPTLRVTNQTDNCTIWVSGVVAGAVIDVDAEPDERFRVDPHEPWYIVGVRNLPEIYNVTSLDPHFMGDNMGFTTAGNLRVEESFQLFFDCDYRSLYGLFGGV